jgi:cytochrome c biogenesis protein CcmG, thiol:disulfide interchange protein DsbE
LFLLLDAGDAFQDTLLLRSTGECPCHCKFMRSKKVDQWLKTGIGLLLAGLGWLIVDTLREPAIVEGSQAPKFAIRADSGTEVTPANFGGKLLLLNFWASWCAPCVDEAPSLNQLSEQLKPAGLVVVGISVDGKEQRYAEFVKHFQLGFPTFLDSKQDISFRYGTYKVPESYLIDRSGKVALKVIGSPGQGGVLVTVDRDGRENQMQLTSPEKSWMDPAVVNMVQRLL